MSAKLRFRTVSSAHYRPAAQRGLTLIELMVSITVGLILVGALAFYFAAQKKTYTYQDALIGLQDSARTAFIHIGRDLRLAGYYGCVPQGGQPSAAAAAAGAAGANIAPPAGTYSRFVRDIVTLQRAGLPAGFELAVMGQNNADADALADDTNQSDRLVINIATPLGLSVAQMDNTNSVIVANNRDDGTLASAVFAAPETEVKKGTVVVVADCQQAAAFVVSNDLASIDGRTLEHKETQSPAGIIDLQHIYGSAKAGPAELLKLRRVRYYIREVGNTGSFSLYRCTGYPMSGGEGDNYCSSENSALINEELVSNVDAMQLQFGIAGVDNCNSDGTANYSYVDALAFDPERNAAAAQRDAALLQTARAVAVKVTLTLSAPGISRDEFTVAADGTRDGPYRQPYSTVVELRNGCKI